MEQVKLSYNLDLSDKSTWLTVTTAPSVRSSFAFVQELGDFYCGPDFYTTRKNLPSYLIKLCLGGAGVLEYGGETYQIKPGHMFWIDCRNKQHYHTERERASWHILWVHLYGPTTKAYHDAFLEQNAGSILVRQDVQSPLLDIFNALFNIYRGGGNTLQDDIQASNLLTQLMVGCIQSAKKLNYREQKPEYVSAIQQYIGENYQEDIKLDVLAQYFSINKFYLQKLFKQHIGLSPNEYLARTRLDRAKQLLRTTDEPIIRIAQDVGYTSTYFDSIFKKYEGITPRAYRLRWYDSRDD